MIRGKIMLKTTITRSLALILCLALLVSWAMCLGGCVKSGPNLPVNTDDGFNTDSGNIVIVTPLPHGESTPGNTYTPEAGSESPVIADETPATGETATAPAETPTEVPTKTAEPEITLNIDTKAIYSRSVLLKDIDTGRFLYSLSPDMRIYPASLTKMMTGLLAAEMLSADKMYEVTSEAIERAYSFGASTGGFEPGEFTDKDGILGGILMASAAECSFTAAIELCGSEEAFVKLMNSRAQELGMNGTHFANCTGLHNDDHYSTVEDLMKLAEHALKNPDFVRFFTLDTFKVITDPPRKDQLTLISTVFSGLANYDYGEVNILGGKTGYTRQAGLCLATYSLYAGHHYILITAANDGNLYTEKYHFIDAEYIYRVLQEELR